jgi:DNA polymerase (family X)
MAAAAQALGWEYLGIADHSKSSRQANGLTEERLAGRSPRSRPSTPSRPLQDPRLHRHRVRHPPGREPRFRRRVLARLDYVVASVHSAFTQDEAAMTARIIRALENPRVTMLGHLTGGSCSSAKATAWTRGR